MSLSMNTQSGVPPGFRFHPTDEELVDYYLKKKVDSRRIDLDVIREIDLYKIEPWDLQEKCKIGSTEQTEWYFFSHKDKKYPTGTRTNRATAAGFWKATGRDKAIYGNLKLIGMRKTLVYYKGRAPNGQKSDWIMHEYRLESCENGCTQTSEEGWVVCRVFRKRCPNTQREIEQDSAFCLEDQMALFPELEFPKVGAHGDFMTCNQPISCKQELDLEYHLSRDPFLHMPQLESPKIACFTSSSSLKGLIMDNMYRPRAELQQYANDSTIFGGVLIQPNILQNAASSSTNVEQQVTDWRALDRLIASQLSQEGTTKEFKLLPSGNDLQGDVALLLAHSKQSNQEYDPYNDIDLLSFAQRDLPTGYVDQD